MFTSRVVEGWKNKNPLKIVSDEPGACLDKPAVKEQNHLPLMIMSREQGAPSRWMQQHIHRTEHRHWSALKNPELVFLFFSIIILFSLFCTFCCRHTHFEHSNWCFRGHLNAWSECRFTFLEVFLFVIRKDQIRLCTLIERSGEIRWKNQQRPIMHGIHYLSWCLWRFRATRFMCHVFLLITPKSVKFAQPYPSKW